jgi:hypothetical protein
VPSALNSALGDDLGQLKFERTIESLTIHGLKDYTADGVRKTKGIRKTATEIAPGRFRQDLFVGLKGAIASGDVTRQVIKSVDKTLSGEYTKGTVNADGTISPYRLG